MLRVSRLSAVIDATVLELLVLKGFLYELLALSLVLQSLLQLLATKCKDKLPRALGEFIVASGSKMKKHMTQSWPMRLLHWGAA